MLDGKEVRRGVACFVPLKTEYAQKKTKLTPDTCCGELEFHRQEQQDESALFETLGTEDSNEAEEDETNLDTFEGSTS